MFWESYPICVMSADKTSTELTSMVLDEDVASPLRSSASSDDDPTSSPGSSPGANASLEQEVAELKRQITEMRAVTGRPPPPPPPRSTAFSIIPPLVPSATCPVELGIPWRVGFFCLAFLMHFFFLQYAISGDHEWRMRGQSLIPICGVGMLFFFFSAPRNCPKHKCVRPSPVIHASL